MVFDILKKMPLTSVDCFEDNVRFNSINSVIEVSPFVFTFGLKSGKLEIVDIRSRKKCLDNQIFVHDNGISHIQFQKNMVNFFTNGRDNKIKFFDIRNFKKGNKFAPELRPEPIWTFNDHVSENFNVNPIFLGNEQFIASGSKDNLVL
jgi:WD40 repeat protein